MMHPEQIVDAVCSVFHVTREALVGSSRAQFISVPRKVAAYLIHKNSELGYKKIAEMFNRSDHTTCLYWVKSMDLDVSCQPHIAQMVADVERALVSPQAEPRPTAWL